MQVAVRIIIVLVIIFLIWLLRRWIRRLIFILILLVLAFFIYGIFSPSGAARLWYNVRTFPQRVTSWVSAGSEFLDYDNYKSKISSIGDKIGDKVDGVIDEVEEVDFGDVSIDENNSENKGVVEENVVSENEENDISDSKEKQTIKKFPKSLQVVKFPSLDKKENERNDDYLDENEFDDGTLTGYSKSDLIGIVNKYVEKNLDDDTDILVTVEYEDDSLEPQKIILQTQKRFTGEIHSAPISGSGLNDLLNGNGEEKVDNDGAYSNENIVSDAQDNHVNNRDSSTKKATSTKLTKKELDEAEEIFSILF